MNKHNNQFSAGLKITLQLLMNIRILFVYYQIKKK